MKKDNNAFTLVELLAVIVILAVVILIAVTAVIPRMNKAKEKSAINSAYVFTKAVGNHYVEGVIGNSNFKLGGKYEVKPGGIIKGNFGGSSTSEEVVLNIENDVPTGGFLNYSNNELTGGCLLINTFAINFGSDGLVSSATKDGSCNDFPSMDEMCPGCVYGLTELNEDYTIGVSTITNFTNNYSSIDNGVFFGVVLNGSNVVQKVYLCSYYNNHPFCLEGAYTMNRDDNIELMERIFDSSDCSSDTEYNQYSCNIVPEVTGDQYSYGSVDIHSGSVEIFKNSYQKNDGIVTGRIDGSFGWYDS